MVLLESLDESWVELCCWNSSDWCENAEDLVENDLLIDPIDPVGKDSKGLICGAIIDEIDNNFKDLIEALEFCDNAQKLFSCFVVKGDFFDRESHHAIVNLLLLLRH